jgi:formate dehydrogenase subunit gamma
MKFDSAVATEITSQFGAAPEMLVQILHAFVLRFGFICEDAIRQLAQELNLSRAEVHGVVSYYDDFRTTAPGQHVVRICQAESCQAMGSRRLTARAEERLGISLPGITNNGQLSLEAVYCLGNCACSPAIMIDDKVYGRVDEDKLDSLIEAYGG